MFRWVLGSVLILSGCATGITPITDPVFVQGFTISNTANSALCSGTYSRSPADTEVVAPIACQDGRTGNVAIRVQPNGHPVVATASLADGSVAHATFLPILGDRHAYATSSNLLQPTPTYLASVARQRRSSASGSYSTSRVYTGNCPTPDSLDAAGRRCGARSAASRAGGYDGYGSRTSSARSYGGRTYVRSYTRKDGTRVSGHYRRSRR